jgi:hypothetical protein
MIRPPRLKVKGMLKIGALLVVVAFTLFVWANARPVPIRVQVTFTGFTNSDITYATTNGTFPVTFAYFCVSNAGKCSVLEDDPSGYDIKNKPFETWVRVHGGVPISVLKFGQVETILLPTPEDNREPWRIALSIHEIEWWRYRLAEKPPWFRKMIMKFVPQEWLSARREWVYSDGVNGPELAPAATNSQVTAP